MKPGLYTPPCRQHLAGKGADKCAAQIDALTGMEPCVLSDRRRERANNTLGKGLYLEKHEASGHAQHDEGGEVAES